MPSIQKHSTEKTGQPATKTCSICGELLPLDQYHIYSGVPKSECRGCHSKRSAARKASISDGQLLWETARYRAKKRGQDFTITIEDVEAVDSDVCPYLEIPMTRGLGKPKDNSKTLDRIDSSRGYVPDNIIVCSAKANRALSDCTADQMALITKNFFRILNSTQPNETTNTAD